MEDVIVHNLTNALKNLYGNNETIVEKQQNRYAILRDIFTQKFTESEYHFFSTPGRTEIGGNHTDHNHGRVLAASVDLDSIAIAATNDENQIVLYSEGYDDPFEVDLSNLKVLQEEKGTTKALIRGIAARYNQLGFKTGGFNACMTSAVLPGSGLSSSASVEVLIGAIFNTLYNNSNITPQELAIIGQYAENEYFGKPCGLMDQLACAIGGIISIDFKDPRNPLVKKVDFDFEAQDYTLLVVDTGGNHADLTEDYASVPKEMKTVAEALSAKTCREISFDNLIKNIKSLRLKTGDRAVLRALHFLGDNERVVHQVNALENGDFKHFLELVNESGNSSFKRLQNIYTTKNVHEQGVSLALALTEDFISGIGEGACRVHGGGFAGTIQVFIPDSAVENYVQLVENVFGKDKVMVLNIRPYGTVYLNDLVS